MSLGLVCTQCPFLAIGRRVISFHASQSHLEISPIGKMGWLICQGTMYGSRVPCIGEELYFTEVFFCFPASLPPELRSAATVITVSCNHLYNR